MNTEASKKSTIKEQVLAHLKMSYCGSTPTEIGLALGKTYTSASSSVNQPLKQLVDEGLVVKHSIDNRVEYSFNRNFKR